MHFFSNLERLLNSLGDELRIEIITSPFSSIGTVIKTPDDGHWQQFIPRQQSNSHLVASFQIIGVSRNLRNLVLDLSDNVREA